MGQANFGHPDFTYCLKDNDLAQHLKATDHHTIQAVEPIILDSTLSLGAILSTLLRTTAATRM